MRLPTDIIYLALTPRTLGYVETPGESDIDYCQFQVESMIVVLYTQYITARKFTFIYYHVRPQAMETTLTCSPEELEAVVYVPPNRVSARPY